MEFTTEEKAYWNQAFAEFYASTEATPVKPVEVAPKGLFEHCNDAWNFLFG